MSSKLIKKDGKGKVIHLNQITDMDMLPKQILQGALEADLDGLVIIGYDKDGEEYFASSYADGGLILWLMARAKLRLLRLEDESGEDYIDE
jgi:hypothetical protein